MTFEDLGTETIASGATGATATKVVQNYTNHTVNCVSSGVSGTVIVQIEGTLDNVNYFNLGTSTTNITTNTSTAFFFEGALSGIRLNKVSGTGALSVKFWSNN